MTTVAGRFSTLNTGRNSAVRPNWVARFGPAMTIVFGFLCFMPYPGISIGNSTSLQLGNLYSLFLLIPALSLRWKHRPVWFVPAILAPSIIAAVVMAITQIGQLDLAIKTFNVELVTLVTLLVAMLLIPSYGLELLTGIAVASVLHALVGIYQAYSFTRGEFPFLGFYVNQSFASIQDSVTTIVKYIQRPFGLFPEPSAMSSSLAPWLILWVAELAGVVRFRRSPAPWQRVLFTSAAIGSLTLILISSSGHTLVTLAGLAVIGAIWFSRLRATRRNIAIVLPTIGLLIPIVSYLAYVMMTKRIEGELHVANSSWDDRSSSIVVGYALWTQGPWQQLFFGLGTGMSSPMVWDAARYPAVWSVLLSYVYETGFPGLTAIALIGWHLIRVWRASRLDITFITMVIVWIIGIAVITSYLILLPIWVTLAWLAVWPSVCEERRVIKPLQRPKPEIVSAGPVNTEVDDRPAESSPRSQTSDSAREVNFI